MLIEYQGQLYKCHWRIGGIFATPLIYVRTRLLGVIPWWRKWSDDNVVRGSLNACPLYADDLRRMLPTRQEMEFRHAIQKQIHFNNAVQRLQEPR